ncbi:MAG TPA: tautomerase family protein [Polyangia bacterium]|jgi:phenylpyruvate tautomerase PptA (4-oxalocrotonate tautomerase family)|nr:tautomerase family protein [Polyangia bacterium]
MPVVTIDTRRGLPPTLKRGLLDAVHEALVACFKVPDYDRAQRIVEHAPEDFDVPTGRGERFTIVTIAAFSGRSLDAKRSLYKTIADRFEALGVPRLDVFIVLQEIPTENWGLRGGVAGSDVALGFKVDV